MLNLRFRQENEIKLEYAPRITGKQWDHHADAVKTMHEDRKTRREILQALGNDFEFRPSMAQLNTHMRKRKLRVYAKSSDGGDDGRAMDEAEDGVLPAEDEVSRNAEIMAQANGLLTSASPLNGAAAKTPVEDILDLLPLRLEPATPGGPETYEESEEDRNAVDRGWRMGDSSDECILAKLEDVRSEAIIMEKVYQEPISHQKSRIVSREASVSSLRSRQSDVSSLRAFRDFAADVSRVIQLRHEGSQGSLCPSTAMIEDNWDFESVTGIHSDNFPLSYLNSPSAADWEACRTFIEELYVERSLSLLDVRDHMAKHYGFNARIRMYKAQLNAWGLGKNVSNQDWMDIAILLRKREVTGDTGPVHIKVRNRTLAKRDYYRFLEYCGVSEEEFLEAATSSAGGAGGEGEDSMPYLVVRNAPRA